MNNQISQKRKSFAWVNANLLGDIWLKPQKEAVLMYHRIIDPENAVFPLESGMYVRPKNFEVHLKFLKKNKQVVSLDKYIRNIEIAKKENLVALTFDDAWVDFKDHALPLLDKYELEASLFIPTKYIGTAKLFWTDIIAELLAQVIKHPEKLVQIQNKLEDCGFDKEVVSKINLDLADYENLSILLNYLKNISLDNRDPLVKSVNNILKEEFDDRTSSPFLNWEDIKEISKNKLINFGQHSHSHYISTEISIEHFKEDVVTAEQLLISKEISLNKIFCYPNEIRNKETDSVLEELGFEVALGKIYPNEKDSSTLKIIDRIGIHDDISSSLDLFKIRLKGL
jgi:peptidoglycan/xylan/chitin deacetylase (PgdA/CDA1 family)